jgi:hypothetical protein
MVRSHLTFANTAAAAALFIALGGGAYAATGRFVGSNGVIRGCVAKSGSVRILAANQSCHKSETALPAGTVAT